VLPGDPPDDHEARLLDDTRRNLDHIGIIPQRLRISKANAVFLLMRGALLRIEVKAQGTPTRRVAGIRWRAVTLDSAQANRVA
jgi:hypothetical protein